MPKVLKCPLCHKNKKHLGNKFGVKSCKNCKKFFYNATIGIKTISNLKHHANCLTKIGMKCCKKCKYVKCLDFGFDPYLASNVQIPENNHLLQIEKLDEYFEKLGENDNSRNNEILKSNGNTEKLGISQIKNWKLEELEEIEQFFDKIFDSMNH